MNNFLATINCHEAPQELIYIILVSVSMYFAISQKSYAGLTTHCYSHRELLINVNVENQHSGRKASCGHEQEHLFSQGSTDLFLPSQYCIFQHTYCFWGVPVQAGMSKTSKLCLHIS